MNSPATPVPKPMIFWALWFAILNGLIIFYFVLGKPSSAPPAGGSSSFPIGLVLGLGPLIASMVVRWAVLPRIETPQKALSVFIVGMALAEGCGVIGIIMGEQYQNLLFIAGALGVLQYIPLFAGRYAESTNAEAPPHTKVVK